jgi:hypothetical protein
LGLSVETLDHQPTLRHRVLTVANRFSRVPAGAKVSPNSGASS